MAVAMARDGDSFEVVTPAMIAAGVELFKQMQVSNLIQRAYEARLDLDEGDEEWIVSIRNRGTTSLRRRLLGRLKRCCIQVGELESYIT
jgi:hypothetical protein